MDQSHSRMIWESLRHTFFFCHSITRKMVSPREWERICFLPCESSASRIEFQLLRSAYKVDLGSSNPVTHKDEGELVRMCSPIC